MIKLKKIIILLIVLLCAGCGKKLTCEYELEYDDVEISNTIIFNFKDNTYKQTDVMTFTDEESASNYFKDVEEFKEEYNLILEKNKIISNLDGEIKLDATKEEIKKQYESYNYKCK